MAARQRKVLIAEDRDCVRKELERLVCREGSGFVFCAAAHSGEEAVEKAIAYQPEVVVLDLDLPGKPGIDAIREMRERGFENEIIILGSRAEFKDARALIPYGISDYITVPADGERLDEALRAVQEKADRRTARERTMRQYIKKAREQILYELLTKGEVDPSVNYRELGLWSDRYQVVIWESRKPEFWNSDLADQLGKEDAGSRLFECVSVHANEVILLKGSIALERFQRWKDSAGSSALVVYGEAVSDMRKIERSYRQCETLRRSRFFEGEERQILSFEEILQEGGEGKTDPAAGRVYGRRLFENMETGNLRGLNETFAQLKDYLCGNHFEVPDVRYFLVDVFLQVKQLASEAYGSGVGELFEGNTAVIMRIQSEPFLQGITDYLAGQFQRAMGHIGKKCGADKEE